MKRKKRQRMTVREIAKIAGVSVATVSRVMNNPEMVSDEKRKKVQKIMEDNNFVPNQLAKNLFKNDSKSIAIFVYDIKNPYFTHLIGEINRIAFDQDYTLIICDTQNDEKRELEYLKYLYGIKISGIILTEGASKRIVQEIGDHVPFIMVDRYLYNTENAPLITSDNLGGARKAVECLINLNHKRIAYVNGPEAIYTSKLRKQGYMETMKKHKLPINDEYIFETELTVQGGVKAIEHLAALEDRPTAIFCANDLIAQGIILRSHYVGLNVPYDFSVVGFDGIVSETFYPKITTVKQQVTKIAEITMEKIIKMINGESYEEKIYIPTKLVMGESCRKLL